MARKPRKTAARSAPAGRTKKAATRKAAVRSGTKKAAAKTAKRPAPKRASRKLAGTEPTPSPRRRSLAAGKGSIAGNRIGDALMLRLEVDELYAAYSYCLDHGNIDDWPDLFVEDCIYKLISRENWDLGLPLGTMFAEKRGGLLDRVAAVKQTSVYHERYLTHMISNTRVLGETNGVVEVSANYLVLETLPNQYTKILNAGRYLDKIVRQGNRLLFKEKICVYDSVLVPASIITPI